jgi:hypothetical protein
MVVSLLTSAFFSRIGKREKDCSSEGESDDVLETLLGVSGGVIPAILYDCEVFEAKETAELLLEFPR